MRASFSAISAAFVACCALAGCSADPSAGVQAVPSQSFANGVGMRMVSLSAGFYVSQYETRRREYRQVMGPESVSEERSDEPIANITGDQALEFCARLTERERAAGLLPEGFVYTLPSFQEWRQYLAQAPLEGSVTVPGQGGVRLERHPLPVGHGEVNRLGIFDLRGNVSEYSRDLYNTGSQLILGASFLEERDDCLRPLNRSGFMSREDNSLDVGFRCVLVPEAAATEPPIKY